jgi:cell division inhibitor SulA/protein ImuA
LQQLANLWRADALAHAAQAGATLASGFATLDAELPGGGWPQGQLIELLSDTCGIGELSLLAPALAQLARQGRASVWILPGARSGSQAPSMTLPYPPALTAAGIDPARCLFVQPDTPREAFWAIEQSLRAAHLGAVLGWLPPAPSREGEFRALRRLQLLAGHQQALVFLLREAQALQTPTPAALRLQLAAHEGCLHVTLLKRRGRPLLDPVVLQVHPEQWHKARIDTAQSPGPAIPETTTRCLPKAALLAQRWSLKVLFSH